jgi:hypothetical protein
MEALAAIAAWLQGIQSTVPIRCRQRRHQAVQIRDTAQGVQPALQLLRETTSLLVTQPLGGEAQTWKDAQEA